MNRIEKQEFQIGEIVYIIKNLPNIKLFEERICSVSLGRDGETIIYKTSSGSEYLKDNIGHKIFKNKESRENYINRLMIEFD